MTFRPKLTPMVKNDQSTKPTLQYDQTVPEPKGTNPEVRRKTIEYDLEGLKALDDTADSVSPHSCIASSAAQDSWWDFHVGG